MRKWIQFLLVLIILAGTVLACNMPVSSVQQAAITGKPKVIADDPNAKPTATPFQPLPSDQPGAVSSPTISKPTITSTLDPSIATVEPTATPWFYGLKVPEGQVKILILGTDWRPDSGYRTDVTMLVCINPKNGSVTVTSFPRDLYVDIPGMGMDRINVTMEFGGFPLTVATFEQNFGIKPDFYVMTNFQGFSGIVNTLGGVNVYTAQNLTDTCKLPQAVNKYCSVGPGWVTMDGQLALWYVRSRYTSNDFDRERRAQEVLDGMFRKLIALDVVTRIPELYAVFSGAVETNLTLGDVLRLIPVAASIGKDTQKVRRYTIGPSDTTDYITPGGAMVLLPNTQAIQKILTEAIFTP